MYINHAVLKRQLAQWIQVKSFYSNIAYQHDDDEFVSKCN